MNVIKIRYRLDSNIRVKKQNDNIEYMIYIRQHSMPLLRTIVRPYMYCSMLYKLGNNKANYTILTENYLNKKSTLFSPKEIKLNPYYVTGFADAKSSFVVKRGPMIQPEKSL